VSQFTLMGYMKGNRPDFHLAMGSMSSETMYNTFVKECAKKYSTKKIQSRCPSGALYVHVCCSVRCGMGSPVRVMCCAPAHACPVCNMFSKLEYALFPVHDRECTLLIFCFVSLAGGQFGAYMNVSLINDGPVTMILDSKHRSGRSETD
jgi:D-Tyr-tRNA(Tyr) deacylase